MIGNWGTRWAFVLTALLGSYGCYPVFAPPIRSNHFAPGAPVPEGQIQPAVGGTFPGVGSVLIRSRLSDHLQWEGGAEVSPEWVLAVAGVRRYWPPRDSTRVIWTDFEIGGGLGLGGTCDSMEWCDDRSPFERKAGGAYAGFGVRVGEGRGALRAQVRGQLSKASGIPTTTWYTGVIGPQLTRGRTTLHLAVGGGGYSNERDQTSGPLLEFVVASRRGPRE